MTGREKIAASFTEHGTTQIGVVVPYEGLYVRDRWDALTGLPWWFQFEPRIDRQMDWRASVRQCMDIDWVTLPVHYSRQEQSSIRIQQEDEHVFLIDDGTGERTPLRRPAQSGWNPAGDVESHEPTDPPDTPEEIDALVPAPPADSVSLAKEGRDSLAKAILQGFGRGLYPIAQVSSPLWRCYDLWGFEGLMTRVRTNPELVKHACSRFLACSVHDAHCAAALGAQAVWLEECLTDMIAPQDFESINMPFLRELVQSIRSVDMKSIYYFCGNPAAKWEQILSAGADALALEEGKKGFQIDIEDVVAVVRGRCAVLGNLDAIDVLQNGTEDELRHEIRRQMAAGRKNKDKFVMSLGSPITPGTSPQRVRLYCDLSHELGASDL